MEQQNRSHDENERIRRFIALDKSIIPADGGDHFNRLIFAESPYLLQHAENPVDWYEWGEDAFTKAQAEDKPIFLSIGYATCHWCHVMAHECFEDEEVAEALNRDFVAIKVDREERPDIDDQYMTVAQMLSGSGGWPLNIIMTPEKKPFFAATYLPKGRRMGLPGIIELLARIKVFWQQERDKVEETSLAIMASLQKQTVVTPKSAGSELETKAFAQLCAMFDEQWGGFGKSPKFPMPQYLSFLLRCPNELDRDKAWRMVAKTLTMMRQGGIYDQIGFGIHRYSVDQQWLVPHFEKMLYDQALVAIVFAEAFQATGDDWYRQVAREILNYSLVNLVGPDGGFCSAQDADTEGEEGKFYLWTPAQVREVLNEEAADIFCRLFDVTEPGNFEGKNILHLPLSEKDFAERERLDVAMLQEKLVKWRATLLQAREKRVSPLKDTKVITAWNGLNIAALAKGYGITGDESYLKAAESAVGFISKHLQLAEGKLLRSYHLGTAKVPAFLEDYAFFVWGLLELYQVTLGAHHLEQARLLSLEMIRNFSAADGGFFDTGTGGEVLLVRQRSAYDGAIPSGNSVAAMNLLRLADICQDPEMRIVAEATITAFSGHALQQPAAYLHMVMAHDYQHRQKVEITLAGEREAADMRAMLAAVNGKLVPGLVLRHAGDGKGEWAKAAEGGATAHVCAKGTCYPPLRKGEDLAKLLSEIR